MPKCRALCRERRSYPLLVEQVVRSEAEKAATKEKKARQVRKKGKSSAQKGKHGRPKGSKNQDKRQIEWTAELQRVKDMASTLLQRVRPLCPLRYFVLDGHFGNNNVMQMVRQCLSLQLISKLRNDSALYFLYDGLQKPVGRKRIYGAKIQYDQIPATYLVETTTQDGIRTDLYQATGRFLHRV